MHPDPVNADFCDQLPSTCGMVAATCRLLHVGISAAFLVPLMLVSGSVSAGGDFPSATDGAAVPRPPARIERHQELRRVLTTPDEYAGPRDERRRLSVDERDALRRELRESMRDVYDERRMKRR